MSSNESVAEKAKSLITECGPWFDELDGGDLSQRVGKTELVDRIKRSALVYRKLIMPIMSEALRIGEPPFDGLNMLYAAKAHEKTEDVHYKAADLLSSLKHIHSACATYSDTELVNWAANSGFAQDHVDRLNNVTRHLAIVLRRLQIFCAFQEAELPAPSWWNY